MHRDVRSVHKMNYAERKVNCDEWDRKFFTVFQLKQHHIDEDEFTPEYDKYTFRTTNDSFLQWPSSSVCMYCDKPFFTSSNMHRHVRNVHKMNNAERKIACDECVKKFFRVFELKQHHTDEHEFMPEYDEYTFRTANAFLLLQRLLFEQTTRCSSLPSEGGERGLLALQAARRLRHSERPKGGQAGKLILVREGGLLPRKGNTGSRWRAACSARLGIADGFLASSPDVIVVGRNEVRAVVTPGPPDNGFESRRIASETTLISARSSCARLLPQSRKRSATPAFTVSHSLLPKLWSPRSKPVRMLATSFVACLSLRSRGFKRHGLLPHGTKLESANLNARRLWSLNAEEHSQLECMLGASEGET
ncbi:hypothetical protein MRX96_040572 [Rhipicephalus microplus]